MSGLRVESVTDVQLYVVQHAEAAAGSEVSLTDAGVDQARLVGHNLASLGIRPDLVLTSPAPQARDTCSLALQAMDCRRQQVIDNNLQEVSQDWDQNRAGGERLLTRLLNPILLATSEQERVVALAFGHSLWTRLLADHISNWPVKKVQTHPMPDASLSLFTYGNEFGDTMKYWRTWYVGKVIEEFGAFNEFSSRQHAVAV